MRAGRVAPFPPPQRTGLGTGQSNAGIKLMRRTLEVLLAGWVVAWLSLAQGCASHDRPSDVRRAEAFAPYQDVKVGDQPIEEFISQRTALLIPGDYVDAAGEKDAWIAVRLRPLPNVVVAGPSQGTAIDRRGYFLTADHCLDRPKLTLVFRAADGLRVTSPRVVARLHDQDVAILSVDSPLSNTFEWAPVDGLRAGEPLFSLGANEPGANGNIVFFRRRGLAGTFERLESTSRNTGWVQHTLTLRAGDSGGPTVKLDGRLVAINSLGTARPFSALALYSARPDPAVISRLIEADFRNR